MLKPGLSEEDLKGHAHAPSHAPSHGALPQNLWHPSGITIWSLFLGVATLLAIAFLAGYIPLRKQTALIASEAREQEQAVPRVDVIQVGRSLQKRQLELPGNIQAIAEAPILARADGYILRRMVDIGDRVQDVGGMRGRGHRGHRPQVGPARPRAWAAGRGTDGRCGRSSRAGARYR